MSLYFVKLIMNLLRREGRRLIGHVFQSNMSHAGVGSSGPVGKMMMTTTIMDVMVASPVAEGAVLNHGVGVGRLRVLSSDVVGACRRMGSMALLPEVRWFCYFLQ